MPTAQTIEEPTPTNQKGSTTMSEHSAPTSGPASTRRGFLGVAGAAGAALGAATLTAGRAAASPSADTPLTTDALVVTVADAASGTFNVLVGERSVPVTDPEFAARIAKAIA